MTEKRGQTTHEFSQFKLGYRSYLVWRGIGWRDSGRRLLEYLDLIEEQAANVALESIGEARGILSRVAGVEPGGLPRSPRAPLRSCSSHPERTMNSMVPRKSRSLARHVARLQWRAVPSYSGTGAVECTLRSHCF